MNTPTSPADAATPLAPTDVLQLIGHGIRWRLLGELAHGDRTVQELTGLVGQPQNLVSYHLGKLRDAGLVLAQRSSADRRDTYYTVDLLRIGTLLSGVGGALHPGLRWVPAPPLALPPVRVLFLCTGNSARSQMAEALARERSRGAIQAFSAGSQPKALHTDAVRVMRERYGIDISAQAVKHLDVYADAPFDRVISLCDQVREVCPDFPGQPVTAHWSVRNPAAGALGPEASLQAFQRTAAELEVRIGFLLAAIGDRAPPPPPQQVAAAPT